MPHTQFHIQKDAISHMDCQAHLLCFWAYNFVIWGQDKNRDVIVAFPDVDPSFISIPQLSMQGRHQRDRQPDSRRALLKETTDSFDQPHLWYSTSEVIRALELFISSGDELSGSNTYRLAFFMFKTPNRCIFKLLPVTHSLVLLFYFLLCFFFIFIDMPFSLYSQLWPCWPDKTSFGWTHFLP